MTKKERLQEKNIDVILETYKRLGLKEETIQKITLEHEAKTQIDSRKEKLADLKAAEPVSLTRYRNARFIMANPLFSCDQKKRIEPIEYRFYEALSTKVCCFELLFSEKPYLARIPAFQINKKSALSQDAHRERVSDIARADLA